MLGDKTQPPITRIDAQDEVIKGMEARQANQSILIRDMRMRIEDLSKQVLNLAVLESRIRKLEACQKESMNGEEG